MEFLKHIGAILAVIAVGILAYAVLNNVNNNTFLAISMVLLLVGLGAEIIVNKKLI